MGVTGAMYKSLRFDGEDSRTYGVYITGEAVFNSPERDVEMISIPGRNGEYARDLGRFMNIEVTYPAGLFGVDPADFADAISDFRNMLGSRVGYCRLEDDYNPGEYRMAVFKAGLEVEPANLEAGEFTITFNCKPQRFLTTGETAVSMTSGDTITNPTLFESRPMLQVWGYGGIDIDGQEVSINTGLIGPTPVMQNSPVASGQTRTFTLDLSSLEIGDPFTGTIELRYVAVPDYGYTIKSQSVTGNSVINFPFVKGTPFTDTSNAVYVYVVTNDGNTDYSGRFKRGGSYYYDGDTTLTVTITETENTLTGATIQYGIGAKDWYGDSSMLVTGSPLYFDLDIGEAYKIEGGVPVSVNNAVTIPAVLPTLKPGSNTITYDNTITQFKVVPRWWKL